MPFCFSLSDREFDADHEYVSFTFLKTFFDRKNPKTSDYSKKWKKSSFQTNGASLFPFEFRISKLSFSDSELKTESEKLSLKVPE